jgi:hypothetical protein
VRIEKTTGHEIHGIHGKIINAGAVCSRDQLDGGGGVSGEK